MSLQCKYCASNVTSILRNDYAGGGGIASYLYRYDCGTEIQDDYFNRGNLCKYLTELHPINNKTVMYKKLLRGDFGPTNPHWPSIQDAAPFCSLFELYGLRSLTPGAVTIYNITWDQVLEMWRPGLLISPMTPNELITIQGELYTTTRGLTLFYSSLKQSMKPALFNGGTSVYALTAKMTLQRELDVAGYVLLTSLLESYPSSIIEFTSYSRELNALIGTVPVKSSIYIWEVRNY